MCLRCGGNCFKVGLLRSLSWSMVFEEMSDSSSLLNFELFYLDGLFMDFLMQSLLVLNTTPFAIQTPVYQKAAQKMMRFYFQ